MQKEGFGLDLGWGSLCIFFCYDSVAGSLEEEQRALATLGRTYFVQSQSDEVGEAETRELLVHAGNAYLRGLDVCDKLGGVVPDR